MEIYFKLIHPDVSKVLVDRAEKKMQRFEKLIHEGRSEAKAYVEITKATGSQHSEAAWQASINVDSNGDRFHAEAAQDTPEKATDRAIAEMMSELRDHQARARRVNRKANGFWKSVMQTDFKSP